MKPTFIIAIMAVSAITTPPRSAAQDSTPAASPKYRIVTLGTLGGNTSAANSVNNLGWAMGAAYLPGNTTEHAAVWINGHRIDLGTLGGPSSSVAWSSVKSDNVISGVSDTSIVDPFGRDLELRGSLLPVFERPYLPGLRVPGRYHARASHFGRQQRRGRRRQPRPDKLPDGLRTPPTTQPALPRRFSSLKRLFMGPNRNRSRNCRRCRAM